MEKTPLRRAYSACHAIREALDEIRAWSETPYVYIKRERQDRVGWTSLGGAMSPTVTATR